MDEASSNPSLPSVTNQLKRQCVFDTIARYCLATYEHLKVERYGLGAKLNVTKSQI